MLGLARQGGRQTTTNTQFPAPVNGLSASEPMYTEGDIGLNSAIWLYNMIPGEYGCRVRKGSKEVATRVLDAQGEEGEVRTLMFYNSVQAGGATDVFFACTDAGIYDITAGGQNPPLVFPWPTPGNNAGWSSYINYTNVAGDHYLLVCDEENGYYIFDGTDWTQGTFTGSPKPLPEDLVHITEWNGRIWFVENDTARAWFLDPLALTGDIAPLDVGSRFMRGGHLVQNTTWTQDDGSGMDDKFVQISSSGDVLVWSGIDPTVASDLTLVGRWQCGKVPEGRRVMSDWGGDVTILTSLGIAKLSALLEGNLNLNPATYMTNKVVRYIRSRMDTTVDFYGWELAIDQRDGIAIISAPPNDDEGLLPLQYVFNITTGSWAMFRDLDMRCMHKNNNGFYFGTRDGRVMQMTGYLDNAPFEDEGASSGTPIQFSLLTHYSHMGQPAAWKRPQFVRPSWIGNTEPRYQLQIRFDFDLKEVQTSPGGSLTDAGRWDEGIWNLSTWGGRANNYFETVGLSGHGRHLAIAIRGNADSELSYIGADLMYDVGGML